MILNIVSAKPHKNLLIVKFEGIDSINDIIPHKGALLFVDEEVIREISKAKHEPEWMLEFRLKSYSRNHSIKSFYMNSDF